jgi:hypothetical protein
MRALVGLVAVTLVCQTACFTPKVIDKWENAPLESAKVTVVSATNERVVLAWVARYRGERARTGELEINPRLPGCEDVRVFVRDAEDETRLLEQLWGSRRKAGPMI